MNHADRSKYFDWPGFECFMLFTEIVLANSKWGYWI